jgi:hypothetical protein
MTLALLSDPNPLLLFRDATIVCTGCLLPAKAGATNLRFGPSQSGVGTNFVLQKYGVVVRLTVAGCSDHEFLASRYREHYYARARIQTQRFWLKW